MLADFHPAVQYWFKGEFSAPTKAQSRGWPEIIADRHTLISAPTGSGKTLTAFLASLDRLIKKGLKGTLKDQVHVVYVSPLKALSRDIQTNLEKPLQGIKNSLLELGYEDVELRTALRTSDTTSSERQAIIRKPPHILVTTPESLYLLLTSVSGRELLKPVETLIVDEIHALAPDRRGAHLSLSLERLVELTGRRVQRIGLSATQKPIELVAEFLTGLETAEDQKSNVSVPSCSIIDEGHSRRLDLAIVHPDSPLEPVMSEESWLEVVQKIAKLILEHGTTLVFVNTRSFAEKLSTQLEDKVRQLYSELGDDSFKDDSERAVLAHHGSLSKVLRLEAERRLREGSLKALVATASLELGIDVGAVDLVCQLGPTKTVATLLQRVGRSGHSIGKTPVGRIFPLTREELIECAALVRCVQRQDLDRLWIPESPLDVLAQQIVAEVASEGASEEQLFRWIKRAYPYRNLTKEKFEAILEMLADGFSTRRGRKGALIHRDRINGMVKGRRQARLLALTSGGAIPDNADFRVILEPSDTYIGTLNEDFAIESRIGDIFQLGNSSWQVLQVSSGVVRVSSVPGALPTIPFWLGEGPDRSDELSVAISELLERFDSEDESQPTLAQWLKEDYGLEGIAIRSLRDYLGTSKKALGGLPTLKKIIIERFFDETGALQIAIHAPVGRRILKAWGLSLRKRFCRTFNFELQAAATEDGILISLGEKHSFPLEDISKYLNSKTVKDVLIQAVLDSPIFEVRWRWNTTRSLAVPRRMGGKKRPPQFQRMDAEDLIAAVFPDQIACLENIAGEREVPEHPLVEQTLKDCLEEAMDIDGLVQLVQAIESGAIECVYREVVTPSPLVAPLIHAKPYAFLDDVPLEERRSIAVQMRGVLNPDAQSDLCELDPHAIDRATEEAWPSARDPDEAHDLLLGVIALSAEDLQHDPELFELLDTLQLEQRLLKVTLRKDQEEFCYWTALESLPLFEKIYASTHEFKIPLKGDLQTYKEALPVELRNCELSYEEAITHLVRGRLDVSGPKSVGELASSLALEPHLIDRSLQSLEAEGIVLRGQFTPGNDEKEWCNRRILARIHRLTLDGLRARIKPVNALEFYRFLFQWQRVNSPDPLEGPEGLVEALKILEGYEAPAGAWESELLSVRLNNYDPLWLDTLCLSGRIGWARGSIPKKSTEKIESEKSGLSSRSTQGSPRPLSRPLRTSPIQLFARPHAEVWLEPIEGSENSFTPSFKLSHEAQAVFETLRSEGASFFEELKSKSGLLTTQTENAIGELVALGIITCDSFAGLRALLAPLVKRSRNSNSNKEVELAGRWSLVQRPIAHLEKGKYRNSEEALRQASQLEALARAYLVRYGVVFRKILQREKNCPPWRELVRIYRQLEDRGEVRGGRFVGGFTGEQFALPEAIPQLRKMRNEPLDDDLVGVSAVDPLNLVGILTPGEKVAALSTHRILFSNGVPIAVLEGRQIRKLSLNDLSDELLKKQQSRPIHELESALLKNPLPPRLRSYYR